MHSLRSALPAGRNSLSLAIQSAASEDSDWAHMSEGAFSDVAAHILFDQLRESSQSIHFFLYITIYYIPKGRANNLRGNNI